MPNTNTSIPGIPQGRMVQPDGSPSPVWYQFFLNLWARTGGATGTPSLILDTISDIAGSMLFRSATQWSGLNPAARFKVLRMGTQFPQWDTLDGNSFGSQAQGAFFKAPAAGAGIPSFQNPLGAYPGTNTNDNAIAGNIGEYISSEIDSGSAVALMSATPADITSISLSPGDWDVWGNIATGPAGGTTTSVIKGWINTASATDPGPPNAGAYAQQQLTIGAGLTQAMPVGVRRIEVAAGPNQMVYLSTSMTFATSTMAAYGFLGARRAR